MRVPFGETRFTTGTMYTDKLYTGQREMAGLGIYHYNARFYSPKLGRFLSADTIVPGYANPQNLNRYSYVINNPLRYVDPTGHMLDYADGGGGVYTPSPPTTNNNNGSNGNSSTTPTSTPTPSGTPTPSMTPTVTPSCTSPSNSCATMVAGQATYVAGQPTMLAWYCQHYPCIGNVPATSTPTVTPTVTPISNNDAFPVEYTIPSIFTWPPDFAPNADDIWDIVGGALPLINQPATSINQIVNNTVNTAINASRALTNALTNGGAAVNQAIGNGLNYGPVIPIFYLPNDPLFGPPTVYN